MSALGRVVRAGVGRKRVQSLVMVLTTMLAVTACVLATGLLVAAQAPFDHAFAQQHGAHLVVGYDPDRATAAQVAATARVPGVTAVAGPYPSLTLVPRVGRNAGEIPVGLTLDRTTLVGRPVDGPLDDLRVTLGHWLTGPGQVVLPDGHAPLGLGDVMTFPDLPGHPSLTVVGLAASMTGSADGWVVPAQIPALTAPGTTPGRQMLYRFARADSTAALDADRAALAAAVPAGALTGTSSYLTVKQTADRTSATFVPFVVAFGVLGLLMSVLIIGVVVSGAVTAATRRIGILKALGFAPAQVVRAYVGQALIPAGIGTLLGVLLGNALAIPVIGLADKALSTSSTGVALWIDLAVPVLALGLVAGTALVPALRAGRLRTVEALTVGRTTGSGGARGVQALLARLPLPRTVGLGLAAPFARPVRSATTTAAVVLGTIGVTFGAGLGISLDQVQQGLDRDNAGAVVVGAFPAPGAAPTRSTRPVSPGDITSAITAQPGTRAWLSTARIKVGVAGKVGRVEVVGYRGDSDWAAYQMVSGTWFHGPGEAVLPSGLLSAYGVHIGDTITLTDQGRDAPVRIVGEALSLHPLILTELDSLSALHPAVDPMAVLYNVDLRPGTDSGGYLVGLNRALRPYGAQAIPNAPHTGVVVLAMDSLALLLTLMLVAVAGLGVLNTVLLDTRERVHDLGVLKALGMAPRQTVAMVLTSVALSGLVAGAIGVPLGIALHDGIIPAMAGAAGTRIPPADLAVYDLPLLVALLFGGLLMAVLGALPPAVWAARTRTATALRTE